MKICINIIATNNYIEFVQPLIDSIDKYFLIIHEIQVNVFSDRDDYLTSERCKIIQRKIPAYKFPDATLLRYHVMTSIDYDCDYIYYLDADMRIVDYVGDEILGDLVAVRHPGYFVANGWGSENCDPKSLAYVPKDKQKKYFAGGFQGGKRERYIRAMLIMGYKIDLDNEAGVMAQWHDETHWNKYLVNCLNELTELNPSYCMPEAIAKRRYSRIENFPPKILALEKDLTYFR